MTLIVFHRTMLTTACHWVLLWASLIRFPSSLVLQIHLSSNGRQVCSRSGSFWLNNVAIFHIPIHAMCAVSLPWSDHPHVSWWRKQNVFSLRSIYPQHPLFQLTPYTFLSLRATDHVSYPYKTAGSTYYLLHTSAARRSDGRWKIQRFWIEW
jgi:hypothetical protein